ncbi:hypothetical protein Sjap_020738 [Stephania japonica]|uniref:Transmembrane protein n=1 Tax=Stephania japonica TaxID=461633 RepID=A0AAP0I0W9_9MAGN
MGSLTCFIPVIVVFVLRLLLLSTREVDALGTEVNVGVLDHVLGGYAFESYIRHNKTGFLYKIRLPSNLSSIRANTVRFRCGSLHRYGTQVKEFHLAIGVEVQPCVERVLIVSQNLGDIWSSLYYEDYNVPGYQLVSPILGLLAYDATFLNSTSPSQVKISSGSKPITIDFSNLTKINDPSIRPFCACFDFDGNVNVTEQVSNNICASTRHGHFGLLVEASLLQPPGKVSEWKIIVGSAVGGILGAFLLGLLVVALLVKVKRKAQMVEMERRAYEEEALQISMVGHVRAPTAAGTRTTPIIEHEYIPPP